jgi:hypothetical protein
MQALRFGNEEKMGFKQLNHCEPAAAIVAKLGGVTSLARDLGGTPGMVSRWISSSEAGGTGGRIPSRHHRKILELAKAKRIKLTAADIIGV